MSSLGPLGMFVAAGAKGDANDVSSGAPGGGRRKKKTGTLPTFEAKRLTKVAKVRNVPVHVGIVYSFSVGMFTWLFRRSLANSDSMSTLSVGKVYTSPIGASGLAWGSA